VTLISQLQSLEHKFSFARGVVHPGWEEATRAPLSNLLKKGKVLHGKVKSVANNVVTLQDGSTLEAEYIILAHGAGKSYFLHGGDEDDTVFKQTLRSKQKAINEAQTILIVGAGPIGVELAGEIKSFHPNKRVVIVHNNAKIISNAVPPMIDKFVTSLTDQIRGMNIELKVNTVVSGLPTPRSGDGFVHGRREYTLSDGSTITADLAIVTTGGVQPRESIVPLSSLDDQGKVKVDSVLRVEGMQDVFCVGDANNVPETKMGYFAMKQAELAASNIIKLNKGSSVNQYIPGDNGTYGTMMVPLGPSAGLAAIGSTILSAKMTSLIKSKGLFTKKTFGNLNVRPPSLK